MCQNAGRNINYCVTQESREFAMKYLKIGEFAKICRTTKDTLLHYEKLGLLRPKLVKANGYRYYALSQWAQYDFITLLKDTGSSLEEILTYQKTTHLDGKFFKDKLLEQQQELTKVQQRINLLSNLIAACDDLKRPQDEISLENLDKPIKIITYPNQGVSTNAVSYEDFLDFASLPFEHINPQDLPLGMIISAEVIKEGLFYPSDVFYGAQISDENKSNFHVLEKGTYAVMLKKGPITTFKQALENMLVFLEKNNLKAESQFYLFDLINFINFRENQYQAKIMIKVNSQN